MLKPHLTNSIYKRNRIFNEKKIYMFWSIIHNKTRSIYIMKVNFMNTEMMYAAAHLWLAPLLDLNDVCLCECCSVCVSVRVVCHSAGLSNLLLAALMEVQIHVHTHNISHSVTLWICPTSWQPNATRTSRNMQAISTSITNDN